MLKKLFNSKLVFRRNASIRVEPEPETTSHFKYILGVSSPAGGSAQRSTQAIPVVTFGLGTWQAWRLRWKLGLIERLEEQLNQPAVELPSDLRQLGSLEYRKVQVRGQFDHSKEIVMQPRSLIEPDKDGGAGGLMSDPSKTGGWVVTPLELAGRGYSILVNRGWVPKQRIQPDSRLEGQAKGEVTLTGIVRNTEHRPQFGLKNDVASGQWNHRDVDAMAQHLQSAPVFIDADRASSVPGGPIGGQTRVQLRNDHLSYLLTWYSLSAITGYMFITKVLRKRL